ncbi:MAG: J domain-containing protein [Lachnospiraceae bacterium]|nr:J domain-containing protein [Lachnospiraceae bacterium]
MAVSSEELRKAMETLNISDVHIEKEQVKTIYKKLLLKWHPDSCPSGEERFYNEISAKINAAYEVIEKAYSEGLMGPDAKTFEHNYSCNYESSTSKQDANYTNNQATNSSRNYNQNTSSNNSSRSQEQSAQDVTYDSEIYDSPDLYSTLIYRYRGLNFIFLTICIIYIIKAVMKSPETDIYIEKSIINLIKGLALYYSIYWFCKSYAACFGFLIPGIVAIFTYKIITLVPMYFYNRVNVNYEWVTMLIYIAVFFIIEYFVHIKKILLTIGHTYNIKIKIQTKILSYIMLLEYAIMLIFGLYSVSLVHKFTAIRNTIMPPWYF